MSRSILAAALVALIALPTLVSAQTAPRIDQRQANQEQRIDQGVSSGQLNKREARRLEKGQTGVNRMENRAKADGAVTNQERRRITKAQNVQSKRNLSPEARRPGRTARPLSIATRSPWHDRGRATMLRAP